MIISLIIQDKDQISKEAYRIYEKLKLAQCVPLDVFGKVWYFLTVTVTLSLSVLLSLPLSASLSLFYSISFYRSTVQSVFIFWTNLVILPHDSNPFCTSFHPSFPPPSLSPPHFLLPSPSLPPSLPFLNSLLSLHLQGNDCVCDQRWRCACAQSSTRPAHKQLRSPSREIHGALHCVRVRVVLLCIVLHY